MHVLWRRWLGEETEREKAATRQFLLFSSLSCLSTMAGMAPITPATSADFWPTRQEAQPDPFDLPSVPQSMHGRRPGAGGLSRPFSGGSPSMYQPCPPLFRTTGATGPSNAVRNLLHSPSRQRPQPRVRGL